MTPQLDLDETYRRQLRAGKRNRREAVYRSLRKEDEEDEDDSDDEVRRFLDPPVCAARLKPCLQSSDSDDAAPPPPRPPSPGIPTPMLLFLLLIGIVALAGGVYYVFFRSSSSTSNSSAPTSGSTQTVTDTVSSTRSSSAGKTTSAHATSSASASSSAASSSPSSGSGAGSASASSSSSDATATATSESDQSALKDAGISTFLGNNTGGIASWYHTDSGTDSTNGRSWCEFPYDDTVPGFAPSLNTMLSSFDNDATATKTGLCGLEAKVYSPATGKTVDLIIADAFDDDWVLTPASIDVIYGSFAELFGESTDDKNDVVKDVWWTLTGGRNEQFTYKGQGVG